jgi:hypothetical protein
MEVEKECETGDLKSTISALMNGFCETRAMHRSHPSLRKAVSGLL